MVKRGLRRAANEPGNAPLQARAKEVAAERPVIAARVAKRAAVRSSLGSPEPLAPCAAARQAGKAAIRVAKVDPNSSLSERAAAGNKRAARRVGNIAKRISKMAVRA
jgi:hypothetical protein